MGGVNGEKGIRRKKRIKCRVGMRRMREGGDIKGKTSYITYIR